MENFVEILICELSLNYNLGYLMSYKNENGESWFQETGRLFLDEFGVSSSIARVECDESCDRIKFFIRCDTEECEKRRLNENPNLEIIYSRGEI